MILDGYEAGIAYSTGSLITDNDRRYLVVRNVDRHYCDCIGAISKYKVYPVHTSERLSYTIKARDISTVPAIDQISNVRDFCRALIEIRGVVDAVTRRRKNRTPYKQLRLRVYGDSQVLTWLNQVLPAKEKSLQHVKTNIGSTCALYYQSKAEIVHILEWLDGQPKNQKIWDSWQSVIESL